jgi:hypothetical protein
MILDTQQYFPEDPVEEGEAVQSISQEYQRKGPGELDKIIFTKLANA